jgi:hypothetical protein
MKIILNTNEIYEIKLPEQIELQELAMITARFNSLLKNFSKFNLMGEETEKDSQEIILGNKVIRKITTHNKEQWKLLQDNRDVLRGLLFAYYNQTPEEFEAFKKQYGITLDRKNVRCIKIVQLIEIHKIKPTEIGLIKYPSRNEDVTKLRIK